MRERHKCMKKKYATVTALGVSIAFMVIGIIQGQYNSVLAKAVRICLECIGIG